MGDIIYGNFKNSDQNLSHESLLKIEVSQAILGIIRDFCEKNGITKIPRNLELEIHRTFLYPIVDRIDAYQGNDFGTLSISTNEQIFFSKMRIKKLLDEYKKEKLS